MSIKSVLEDLVNHSVKRALGYAPNNYADKDISQAHSAILAEFRKCLGARESIIKDIHTGKSVIAMKMGGSYETDHDAVVRNKFRRQILDNISAEERSKNK